LKNPTLKVRGVRCEHDGENTAGEYISPFSVRRYRSVAWQEVGPAWAGIYRAVIWADAPVLEYLKHLKFATRSQLLRHCYGSRQNGIKRLERMARTGILVRHSLTGHALSAGQDCPGGRNGAALYTLGPLGCELLHQRWVPNWWRDISLVNVLKQLVTGDLYRGFASIWPCAYAEAEWPLTAWFNFGGLEYGILVLRDDVEQVRPQITRAAAMRLIIAVECLGDAARLNIALDLPARFILDRDLVGKQFSQCDLFRFEDGKLLSERLPGQENRGRNKGAVADISFSQPE
jgi:hypothetical protein